MDPSREEFNNMSPEEQRQYASNQVYMDRMLRPLKSGFMSMVRPMVSSFANELEQLEQTNNQTFPDTNEIAPPSPMTQLFNPSGKMSEYVIDEETKARIDRNAQAHVDNALNELLGESWDFNDFINLGVTARQQEEQKPAFQEEVELKLIELRTGVPAMKTGRR